MALTTTSAATTVSTLAASLGAATRFGPNLYATAAPGAHLPTVATRLLEENARSAAPAERIVLRTQQGNSAFSTPSSDAQQLGRLAERFSVQIDVKAFGQVQEFIPATMRAEMAATGVMMVAGKTEENVDATPPQTAPRDLGAQIAEFLQSPTKATASRRAQALRRRGPDGVAALLAIRAPFDLRYHSHGERERMTATNIRALQFDLDNRSKDSNPNQLRSREYHVLSEVRKASERALEQVEMGTIGSLLTHENRDARFGAISRLLVEFDYHTRGIHHDIVAQPNESFRDVKETRIPAAIPLAEMLLKQSLTDPDEEIRDYLVSLIQHDLTSRSKRFNLVWKELLRDAPEPLREGAREISMRIRSAR